MSTIGHNRFREYWYHTNSSKDYDEDICNKDEFDRPVVIKVKKGWRVSYYHRNNDSGDYELISAEDNGFKRSTALPKSEVEAIESRLKKEYPDAEISHVEKS